jgi:PAS domain S-box-containing protein
VKWVRERAKLEFDGKGALLGGFGTTQDITDHKRIRQELLDTQQRYARVFESSMDAMVTIDSDQRILLFNFAAEKMFGCKADEAFGKPINSFIPERFHHAHGKHISMFADTGVTNRKMGKLDAVMGLRANGEEFPVEAFISQCEIDGKKLFTAILRDITERKNAENELFSVQARLALVVEKVKAGYWDWDLHSNALYLSPEWNRQLGLDDDDLLLHWDRKNDRLHPDDCTMVTEATENYIAGRQPNFELQFCMRHKDGSYRWIHSHGALLRDNPFGCLGLT